MDENEKYSFDNLEKYTYRVLQKLAKSLALPSNVKKVYLKELIHTKKFGTEEELESIIHQVKVDRLKTSQARKKKKIIKKLHLQGTEITSTSGTPSSPVSQTAKRPDRIIIECKPDNDSTISPPKKPIKTYSSPKKTIGSDRVLRSFNTTTRRPNYSILNSSVVEVFKTTHMREKEKVKQSKINMTAKCVVKRMPVNVWEDEHLVPISRSSSKIIVMACSSLPEKRQRTVSGIYPITQDNSTQINQKYFKSINFRCTNGRVSKINAVIQKTTSSINIPVQNLKSAIGNTQITLPNHFVKPFDIDYPNLTASTDAVRSTAQRKPPLKYQSYQYTKQTQKRKSKNQCVVQTDFANKKPESSGPCRAYQMQSQTWHQYHTPNYYANSSNYIPDFTYKPNVQFNLANHKENYQDWTVSSGNQEILIEPRTDSLSINVPKHHRIDLPSLLRTDVLIQERMGEPNMPKIEEPSASIKRMYMPSHQKVDVSSQRIDVPGHQRVDLLYSHQSISVLSHQKKEDMQIHLKADVPRHERKDMPSHQKMAASNHQKNVVSSHHGADVSSHQRADAPSHQKPYYQKADVPMHQRIDVPIYQRTDVPSYQAMDVPSYYEADVRCHQRIDVPSYQKNAVQSHQRIDVPSHQVMDVQSYLKADVPSHQVMDVPIHQRIDVPSYNKNVVQSHQRIDVPSHQEMDVPSYDKADVPNHQVMNVPIHQRIDAPSYQKADVQSHQAMDVPSHYKADVRSYQRTDVPSHQAMDVPSYQRVDVPSYQRVDVPCYQKMDMPSYVRPHNTYYAYNETDLMMQQHVSRERLPKINAVFSKFNNIHMDVTQPLYVQVSEESERLPISMLKHTNVKELDSLYNIRSQFTTNEPLLMISTTRNTASVHATKPVMSCAVPHRETSSETPNVSLCELADPYQFKFELEAPTAAPERLGRMQEYDTEMTASDSSLNTSRSQDLDATIPEMVEDAIELISQDGDYMERLGMDVKVQCALCEWTGFKLVIEYHLRNQHSDRIDKQEKPEWNITFSLHGLIQNPSWQSHVVELDNTLYILSVKYQQPDGLMAALYALYDDTIAQESGSITIYNKVTGEPFTWEGDLQHLPANFLNENDTNCLKLNLSKLHLLPNSADIEIINGELVTTSSSKVVVGNVELRDLQVIFFVKIFKTDMYY